MPAAQVSPAQPLAEMKHDLDKRPGLVMLCNAQTPYRLALHLRLAREIPQVRLYSVFTHEVSNSPWVLNSPPEIGAVQFGRGESAESTASTGAIAGFRREWAKGGRVIDWLGEVRPAVVILHGYNDAGRLRVLAWCRKRGIPVYLWGDSNARSDQARGLKRWVKARLLHWILARCKGVMSCGSLGRDFFVNYGASPQQIIYVPYEPDYNAIASLPQAEIDAAAKQFGLTAGRRRIVYSGRLVDVKRVDLLIKAFVTIAAERPEWDLVIVGDGNLRQDLQSLVPQNLISRVTWCGFQNNQNIVSAIYRNCHVLVLPSTYEPWALVINEAAAAGLAIVASDVVGAAAELVRNDVNGFLFKTSDEKDLEQKLRSVTGPRYAAFAAGSATVLADWRRRADPVEGIRTALRQCGVTV
jgi:glycosyltransferase involved in cell wall biosynthesis